MKFLCQEADTKEGESKMGNSRKISDVAFSFNKVLSPSNSPFEKSPFHIPHFEKVPFLFPPFVKGARGI